MPRTKTAPNAKVTDDGFEEILPGPRRHNPYWTPKVIDEPTPEPVKPIVTTAPAHRFSGETDGEYHDRRWNALIAVMQQGLELRQALLGTIASFRAAEKPTEEPAIMPRARAAQLLSTMREYHRRYDGILTRLEAWEELLKGCLRATQAQMLDGNPAREIADTRRALRHPIDALAGIGPAVEVDPENEDSLRAAADDLRRVREVVRQADYWPEAFAMALWGLVEKSNRFELRWNEAKREGPVNDYAAFRLSPPSFYLAPLPPVPPKTATRVNPWGDIL